MQNGTNMVSTFVQNRSASDSQINSTINAKFAIRNPSKLEPGFAKDGQMGSGRWYLEPPCPKMLPQWDRGNRHQIDAENVSKNDSKIIRQLSQNDRDIYENKHLFAKL